MFQLFSYLDLAGNKNSIAKTIAACSDEERAT